MAKDAQLNEALAALVRQWRSEAAALLAERRNWMSTEQSNNYLQLAQTLTERATTVARMADELTAVLEQQP